MIKKTGLSLLLLCLAAFCFAQDKKEKEPEYEMRTYYMVFLKRGPVTDTTGAKATQAAHMQHIGNMHKAGKLAIAGPFTDGGELRGIFILTVASIEEAKALADADPAVKAGRLIMEIHPWMSARGICLP